MGECCSCPDCRFDRVGDTNCPAYDSMMALGEHIVDLEHRIEMMYHEILENGSWAGFCTEHPEAREWINEGTGEVK